jgi:hypothetical protein
VASAGEEREKRGEVDIEVEKEARKAQTTLVITSNIHTHTHTHTHRHTDRQTASDLGLHVPVVKDSLDAGSQLDVQDTHVGDAIPLGDLLLIEAVEAEAASIVASVRCKDKTRLRKD